MGKASALIVPIEWDEPFGIVFAESLACGTPVISCRRGGVPEIVRHGLEGFLIESVEEGAAAVGKIKAIDRRACRKRAEVNFSTQSITDNYADLYHRRLRSPSSA